MALLDLFKKKKEPDFSFSGMNAPGISPSGMPPMGMMPLPTQGPPTDVPLNQVISLQSQGLTNNQIIQTLQRQGYAPQPIYDALAQSEAKKSIEPMIVPGESAPPRSEVHEKPSIDQTAIVEQIIEEKWHDLQKDVGKMNEWKELITSRIDKLEQSMSDVKMDLDGLHKAIVARIGEYDKTLMDVGTEIKAMEKVFQKVLPELTGNIQELSRITRSAKTK